MRVLLGRAPLAARGGQPREREAALADEQAAAESFAKLQGATRRRVAGAWVSEQPLRVRETHVGPADVERVEFADDVDQPLQPVARLREVPARELDQAGADDEPRPGEAGSLGQDRL